MLDFDPSQLAVLACDPGRHLRVLGAPGSGKSALVVEAYARLNELGASESSASESSESGSRALGEGDLLILAPSRLAAAQLRTALERRLPRAIGGTPVRTVVSLAFAILARAAAGRGDEMPRLLTGTVHDEFIARAVEELLASNAGLALAPEVLRSERFRTELRELWRVLDDSALTTEALRRRLVLAEAEASDAAYAQGPVPELAGRWGDGCTVIDRAAELLAEHRSGELSASGLLRAATAVLLGEGEQPGPASVPRLILIDDAQQLTEGGLALVAACARLGSRVWVFGDPDTAASAFQGERAAVLSNLRGELERRGAGRGVEPGAEQLVVLASVHRHPSEIRELVSTLTSRIGSVGAGGQRVAASGVAGPSRVEFASAGSSAEQLGALAYRLRSSHLGLHRAAPVPWERMAVICRSRDDVTRVARLLAEREVPAGELAGGIVLREHRIVRDLIALLRHALQLRRLSATEIAELLSGPIVSLDRMAVRRLRAALLIEERRNAREDGREAADVDDLLREAVEYPGSEPLIDSAGGRALRRLGQIAGAGRRTATAGGSAREALWAIWEATGIADRLQAEALAGSGVHSDTADRMLDAVVGLFFGLQRHEEQGSEQPVSELLDEILVSSIPEDSLARRSARDRVVVTTAQGAIGFEFDVVCVIGVQDGAWPNLRAQGSVLGVPAFERWVLGGAARESSRIETLHDELRLFALACSRAREELLVLSIRDDEHHPGPFFLLGRDFEREEPLPSERLSLRGAVARERRRLIEQPDDALARASLAALARAGVPGAHPRDWYGVMEPSSTAPLVDLEGDPDATVSISPSQLERAEDCPLSWVLQQLGASDSGFHADLGTLMHAALEHAESDEHADLLELVTREWPKLRFDAEWERERELELARAMVEGLREYLRQFRGGGGQALASEARFRVELGRAILRGTADRLELRRGVDGALSVSILDLKTGKTKVAKADLPAHAQLQAYQLGVSERSFSALSAEELGRSGIDASSLENGGASLLYVHPDAVGKTSPFVELKQEPMGADEREAFVERVAAAARIMAGAQFTARVEHHCTDPYKPGSCRLHVIPAVSRS